jgi:PAS domain-containing protein
MTPARRSFDDELARLFDLSHDAFCIAGFDGCLKRANPAFHRLLGCSLDELLALPFVENVYPGDRKLVEAALSTNAGWPTTSWARCAAWPPWLRRAWRHLFDEVVVAEQDRTIGASGSRDRGVFVVAFVA